MIRESPKQVFFNEDVRLSAKRGGFLFSESTTFAGSFIHHFGGIQFGSFAKILSLHMILVTGADGQLGHCFQLASLLYPEITFHFACRAALDITQATALRRYLVDHTPRWIINCAAYTAVDKAENEPLTAQKINVKGVHNLASACADLDIGLVHFSTDYVYHSRQNTPFTETDKTSPKGVYARTKRLGERAALLMHPSRTVIIRTSWVYSAFGNNFVNTMLRLGAERAELNVVADQIGSPTYAPDLAEAVIRMLTNPGNKMQGIYNFSNEGVASWYDFARAIMEISGLPCRVNPILSREYPTTAQRPPFSVMDKTKIKKAFGLEIPYWRDSLRKCIARRG